MRSVDTDSREGARLGTGGVLGRLITAIEHATGRALDAGLVGELWETPETDPNALSAVLTAALPARFSVTGTLDRRILFAEREPSLPGWTIADLSGHPHQSRAWPPWTRGKVVVDEPTAWLSKGHISGDAVYRLRRPRVLLTALYHPEWFPLPRFPLAISDLGRAARSTLLGQVTLMDMQLGVTHDDITAAVRRLQPDIVGVSATFGQHDLTIALLDYLFSMPKPPLVLAGGSLTARNEAMLLESYPALIIARGAGEPTIADALGYFHHDLALDQVRGIGYADAGRGGGLAVGRPRQHTATLSNRAVTDFLPELDLLDATFERHGVAQLETSRGCTSACSFCPRGHKGKWAPGRSGDLEWMLAALGTVFDRHPGISRTLYLVDEEIIGRGADAVPRALSTAGLLHEAGLAWESSCRIDQVVRPEMERAWHVERARMWRELVRLGLRRMLFGVESGVTSILERFNKETTGEQNALAIRTLSALGVPTRFTYITFDHLMTPGELSATHAFQGRLDLLLRPVPHLSAEEVVAGVADPAFVAEHAINRPFYTGVSYMLVSMECLIGAAYTRAVHTRGLAGAIRPSMGRVDAAFADWRIGACSRFAQLWIDRNFALDYTAKSLEKILDGTPRSLLHQVRVAIRHAAYAVLTRMLRLVEDYEEHSGAEEAVGQFEQELKAILNEEWAYLAHAMAVTVAAVLPSLPQDAATMLQAEHLRWQQSHGWRLINAAEACGT